MLRSPPLGVLACRAQSTAELVDSLLQRATGGCPPRPQPHGGDDGESSRRHLQRDVQHRRTGRIRDQIDDEQHCDPHEHDGVEQRAARGSVIRRIDGSVVRIARHAPRRAFDGWFGLGLLDKVGLHSLTPWRFSYGPPASRHRSRPARSRAGRASRPPRADRRALSPKIEPRAFLLGAALQAIVVGGGLLALATGNAEEARVEAVVPDAALDWHEDLATIFVIAAAATLVGTLAASFGRGRAPRGLAVASTAASVGFSPWASPSVTPAESSSTATAPRARTRPPRSSQARLPERVRHRVRTETDGAGAVVASSARVAMKMSQGVQEPSRSTRRPSLRRPPHVLRGRAGPAPFGRPGSYAA